MKIGFGALAALLLAGIAWSAAAQAQGVPQGSYLQSCGNVGIQGDTLVANCRTADGRDRRAALNAVSRCVGDIANNNGNLQCNQGGGGQSYGQQPSQPGYGSQLQPGYGAQPYGQIPQQSGYGQPR
jgi:hypothetical protein